MSTPLAPGACQGNWGFANSLGLLMLRLVLGWIFFYHGSQKVFGAFGGMGMGGEHGFVAIITGLHLPVLSAVAWAWMAACGEFFGGVFVFLGLLTRLAAVPIIVTMLVAIGSVTGSKGFAGYEFNLALIAMSVTLILTGGGLVSLDALLFKRGLWSRGPQPLDQPMTRG
jgi:putative oxidoreductase